MISQQQRQRRTRTPRVNNRMTIVVSCYYATTFLLIVCSIVVFAAASTATPMAAVAVDTTTATPRRRSRVTRSRIETTSTSHQPPQRRRRQLHREDEVEEDPTSTTTQEGQAANDDGSSSSSFLLLESAARTSTTKTNNTSSSTASAAAASTISRSQADTTAASAAETKARSTITSTRRSRTLSDIDINTYSSVLPNSTTIEAPSHTHESSSPTTTTAATTISTTTYEPDIDEMHDEQQYHHEKVDVIAIIPDRTTPYANGVHNGLILAAKKLNITLEIMNVGNFNLTLAQDVMNYCIYNKTTDEQPSIYLIWPIDIDYKSFMKLLYQRHKVPIIQMNQYYGIELDDRDHDDEDEDGDGHDLDDVDDGYLLGYAGQSDTERATNAGTMMVQALIDERQIENPTIVALGYPLTYGGFYTSVDAFRKSISNSSITLVEALPIEWGSQNAYDQMVLILDALIAQNIPLHGVYAMDDDILLGAYQAIVDRRTNHHSKLDMGYEYDFIHSNKEEHDYVHAHHALHWLDHITLIGSGCNGARSLLVDRQQYGTTVQSPLLEALLAMDTVNEYLTTGSLTERIRYTPNPIITHSTVKSMIIEFMDELYAADDLCTWNLHYVNSVGLYDKYLPNDICDWVECNTIPKGLLYAGYTMVFINVTVAVLCAVGVILYRNKQIMKLAQPPFLMLVILGTFIDTCSILFMNQDNISRSGSSRAHDWLDTGCLAWPCLLTLGQMMTTATLVAKIYRVKAVTVDAAVTPQSRRLRLSGTGSRELFRRRGSDGSFSISLKPEAPPKRQNSDVSNGGDRSSSTNNDINATGRGGYSGGGRGLRRVKVTARDVSGFIVVGLLLDGILLLVWRVTDPFLWDIEVVSHDEEGHILSARGTCTSQGDNYWLLPFFILLLHFGLLIYANILAYQTRRYHEISNSKMVAICLFNSIQLLMIAAIMFALSGDNVSISYLVRSSYAFLNNLGVLLLVVLPKIYSSVFVVGGDERRSITVVSGLHPPYPSYSGGNGSSEFAVARRFVMDNYERNSSASIHFDTSSASLHLTTPVTSNGKKGGGNTGSRSNSITSSTNSDTDPTASTTKALFDNSSDDCNNVGSNNNSNHLHGNHSKKIVEILSICEDVVKADSSSDDAPSSGKGTSTDIDDDFDNSSRQGDNDNDDEDEEVSLNDAEMFACPATASTKKAINDGQASSSNHNVIDEIVEDYVMILKD